MAYDLVEYNQLVADINAYLEAYWDVNKQKIPTTILIDGTEFLYDIARQEIVGLYGHKGNTELFVKKLFDKVPRYHHFDGFKLTDKFKEKYPDCDISKPMDICDLYQMEIQPDMYKIVKVYRNYDYYLDAHNIFDLDPNKLIVKRLDGGKRIMYKYIDQFKHTTC